MGRVEFGHRTGDTAPDVVGEIDIDIIKIEIDCGVAHGGSLVEVFRNHDDGGDALLSNGAFRVRRGHLFEQVGVGVRLDQVGHARGKPALALHHQGDRLLSHRVR